MILKSFGEMISEVFNLLFLMSIGLILYVYIGYPFFLYLLSVVRKKGKIVGEIEPFVTFIISAYNEERVIGRKIENTLALDYPKDKLEIIVVSDCSSDKTDDIVRSFRDKGVILLRLNERRGKTYGLNQAVAKATGEIIVFSDANAMYEPDAIRKLIRNFADESVGYVVGESRYAPKASSVKEEDVYWRYEQSIKRRESDTGSIVGADGAIYAIRKELYEPLRDSDINDVVNPLQIIAKGYRGVYEPEAVCWEKTAASYEGEFRRKIRIVNRSLMGIWRVRKVLNLLRYGLFSWKLISHKLIRWFVPFLMIMAFLSNLMLVELWKSADFFKITLAAQSLFYLLAGLGYIGTERGLRPKLLSIPYYLSLIHI